MKKWIFLGIIVFGIGGFWFLKSNKTESLRQLFEIVPVKKGTIVYEVTATGKIQPINTISVGTQVSGIIEQVLADYNDEVKEGQLLAKLDASVLIENKNDAKARLDLAKAKEDIAKLDYARVEKLYKDKLIAKTSLEESEIKLKTAQAEVLIAEAEYNKAERNFGYASITSPVSGTVISKEVEQGQTVAASLSTPTLFTIAEDLSKMQIEASIAEADIGVIVPEMPVTFTVDAYPNDKFKGIVKQIRLSPTEEQNVVMYTVVIEVDNDSRKLLPGMTASVNIKVKEAKDVLTLPAMALQYKPSAQIREKITVKQLDNLKENEVIVYSLKGNEITPTIITKGLSDMTSVEILGGLKLGDTVILDAKGAGRRRGR